jgi:hypothetical protein
LSSLTDPIKNVISDSVNKSFVAKPDEVIPRSGTNEEVIVLTGLQDLSN